MVSQLLYDLPASERYRIVFIERDLDEMLASQAKMLTRLGRVPAPARKCNARMPCTSTGSKPGCGGKPGFGCST